MIPNALGQPTTAVGTGGEILRDCLLAVLKEYSSDALGLWFGRSIHYPEGCDCSRDAGARNSERPEKPWRRFVLDQVRIADVIAAGDVGALSSMPGIGSKTAHTDYCLSSGVTSRSLPAHTEQTMASVRSRHAPAPP